MKKTKAKPVKGSARTKKFDAGGLAALAGLGALAYMMRKKKGESEASVPTDKSGYSSGPINVGRMIEGRGDAEPSAEVKRAMAASQGRDELIPEGATDADRATMYGDTVAKRTMPAAKRTTSSVGGGAKANVAAGQRARAILGEGKRNEAASTAANAAAQTRANLGDDIERRTLVAGGAKPISENSPQAKAMRGQRKQRLGSEYAKLYSAYQNAPASDRDDPQAQTKKEALRQSMEKAKRDYEASPLKKGGKVKKYASGGSVSSASKRADGIAQRGKTRGRVC